MMKLELKHLAPYLPYDLRIKQNNMEYSLSGTFLDEWFNWGVLDKEVKPILRPISDLIEEIEINGDKFVPIYRLFEEMYPNHVSEKYYYQLFYNSIRASHYNTSFELKILIGKQIFENPQNIFTKLIEWNFDVFELIPHNLAIDINTLK